MAQDNEFATWNAWGNQSWPAKYLIDAQGQVRYTHFGEGDYDETEQAIRALLEEAGQERLGGHGRGARPRRPIPAIQTPETYLGSERAQGFLPEPPRRRHPPLPGRRDQLPPSHFALKGRVERDGRVRHRRATARRLDARFLARKVFLVMSSRGRAPAQGARAARRQAGVRRRRGRGRAPGRGHRHGERLYRLVSLPRPASTS